MKRAFILVTFIMSSLFMSAQNQSWTATAIDGNTYDIAAIVDSGKTVLVDISAYWCMPCWDWHQTGIMEKLYEEFGPNGTNDVRMFFIDADAGSTIASLQGAGALTMGNWIVGTPYPIIGPYGQGAAVRSHYILNGYPTLFMHCPGDSTGITVPMTPTLEMFLDNWKNNCPAGLINGPIDATLFKLHDKEFCTGQNASTILFNQGSDTLRAATLELRKNGILLDTKNWSGALAPFTSEKVSFDNHIMTSSGTYEKTVIVAGDANLQGNIETELLTVAPQAPSVNMTLDLQCDGNAYQTSWKLFDSNDLVIAESPATNYVGHNFYTYDWNLSPNSCYTFRLYDSGTNGICCYFGQGYYHIRSTADSTNLFLNGGFFNGQEESKVFYTPDLNAGMVDIKSDAVLQMFPNPTDGILKIKNLFNSDGNYSVTNMEGKIIATGSISRSEETIINLQNFPNGIYTIAVINETVNQVNRVALCR
ncbi:MAG: T9SS type A sorting domain-containing protein [Bacteroidota bacterium]